MIFYQDNSVSIYNSDARDMSEVGDSSIQCVITSPPYWGLRDYGIEGQIGIEDTPEAYLETMVAVSREVRRVLKKDGTLWLNLGDSYNGRGGAGGDYNDGGLREGQPRYSGRNVISLKPKDLIGIPWRVAFALQADGWYLRSDIIWSKPNPMPESVQDRPTRSHEYLFLLAKSERYYYDIDAIREPFADVRNGCDYGQPNAPDAVKSPYGQGFTRRAQAKRERDNSKMPAGWDQGEGSHLKYHREGRERPERQRNRGGRTDGFTKPNNIDPSENGGRNRRTVWTISTSPYPEAHFATFPEALIEPCILAGSRPGDIVLDPFMGSGTTAWVAKRLGRRAIGYEINSEYCELIIKRNRQQAFTI